MDIHKERGLLIFIRLMILAVLIAGFLACDESATTPDEDNHEPLARSSKRGLAYALSSNEDLAALHKRLKNIIKKSDRFFVSENLLIEKEEKVLFDIFKETKIKIETAHLDHDYLQGCSQFLEMKPVIDEFFDKVLVMAEDQEVRQNRIALLQRLDELLSQIADFSLIVETK